MQITDCCSDGACCLLQCVSHMVVEEEEPADAHRAAAELQKKNEDLLEQLHTQKQLQKDLQTQLHDSQRSCAQLRTQVTLVCSPVRRNM